MKCSLVSSRASLEARQKEKRSTEKLVKEDEDKVIEVTIFKFS